MNKIEYINLIENNIFAKEIFYYLHYHAFDVYYS